MKIIKKQNKFKVRSLLEMANPKKAIKVLKEEAKNKLYSFGLKDAEQFLKGYER